MKDSKNQNPSRKCRKQQPLVGPAIHRKTRIESEYGFRAETIVEDRAVTVMALSGRWAMVRRKGCIPYTCNISELVWPNDTDELRADAGAAKQRKQ